MLSISKHLWLPPGCPHCSGPCDRQKQIWSLPLCSSESAPMTVSLQTDMGFVGEHRVMSSEEQQDLMGVGRGAVLLGVLQETSLGK